MQRIHFTTFHYWLYTLYVIVYVTNNNNNKKKMKIPLKLFWRLQSCFNLKTPCIFTLKCLFYYFSLITIVLKDFVSLSKGIIAYLAYYTASKCRLYLGKSRLYRSLYIILTIICHFRDNADRSSNLLACFYLPLCSIREHTSIKRHFI